MRIRLAMSRRSYHLPLFANSAAPRAFGELQLDAMGRRAHKDLARPARRDAVVARDGKGGHGGHMRSS